MYAIPEHLKALGSDWATTLVRLYCEPVAHPGSVSPTQGDLLRILARNLSPITVVEIGCKIGISTLWLAQGVEEIGNHGIVHSVDRFPALRPYPPLNDTYAFVTRALESAGLTHRVRLHRMDSREFARQLKTRVGAAIDLVFIDGDHTVQGCTDDFRLYAPHVSLGGYIVLHDINPADCGWDGPRYVIDNLVKPSSSFEVVEISTAPYNFGMALIRKVGPAGKQTE